MSAKLRRCAPTGICLIAGHVNDITDSPGGRVFPLRLFQVIAHPNVVRINIGVREGLDVVGDFWHEFRGENKTRK